MKIASDKCRVTAENFCQAWRTVWERDEAKSGEFAELYAGTHWKPMTEYMLTCEKSFLWRVAKELGFENRKNGQLIAQDSEGILKLDMALVRCNKFKDKVGYPTLIDVMIEHENKVKSIIDEMWKLMLMRSPLKVIITYSPDPNGPDDDCRLPKLLAMLEKSNSDFPENEDTTYLFIVGQQTGDGIQWWRASNELVKFKKFC